MHLDTDNNQAMNNNIWHQYDEDTNKGNMIFSKINHKSYHETVLTCSQYEKDMTLNGSNVN